MTDAAAVIDLEGIDLALAAADRDGAVRALTARLHATGRVADVDAVVRSALEREEIGSTNIGFGVAIPHAKTDAVVRPGFAFGRRLAGVTWPGEAVADAGGDAQEDHRVQLVFMIASPPQATDGHLRMLASLARGLMDEAFREALLAAPTPEDALAAIRDRLVPA